MYKFSEYLKLCRENLQLTQNQLVENLISSYHIFSGLDTTTLSRWERGISKPPISKQTKIIKYFSEEFERIFPFIEDAEHNDIESSFCNFGFSKKLSKHKLVMNFPTQHIPKEHFTVKSFNKSALQHIAVNKNIFMFKELYGRDFCPQMLMAIVKSESNYGAICECNDEYFGHYFGIKLKPAIYEKVIHFKFPTESLTQEDLANSNEPGSMLYFGFFAMSDYVMSLLWAHTYAWIIKRQNYIQNIGALISTPEGKKMGETFNMTIQQTAEIDGRKFYGFSGTTPKVLLTEFVVKLLFNPDSCQEDL